MDLFARGVGRAGRARGDAMCAALYAGGAEGARGDALCALCMLEAVEGRLCLLEVTRCVLFCTLEGSLCLLEVVDVAEMMRCVLLCILDAALFAGVVGGDGRGGRAGRAGRDTVCATVYAGGCGRWVLFARGVEGARGDAVCATLYARGCEGWALFAGGGGGHAPCTTLHARRGFGGMETRSRCADVEVCRHGALELWRRAVVVASKQVWSSGAWEACGGRVGLEEWCSEDRELAGRAAGV